MHLHPAVASALAAAFLFGASTPLAKLVLGEVSPVLVAGLLYLGSGVGLTCWLGLRRWLQAAPGTKGGTQGVARADLPWLAAVVITGGVAAPVLLMWGLAMTDAASTSLLLNMEAVLTALLAWFVFKEQFDRRIFIGMLLIVIAGGLLAWTPGGTGMALQPGPLLVVAACLCWAVDNNLTRKISGNDAVQITAIKGLAAAAVNIGIAVWSGAAWPALQTVLATAAIGLAGYGISLVLFVVALRGLGAARTGAYFSTAPFVGAALSLLVFRELPPPGFWIAGLLMAAGLWLHLSERHAHWHRHEAMDHAHPHRHDEHHQHTHDFEWDGQEPHVHAHHHGVLGHRHAHFPDLHHRHRH